MGDLAEIAKPPLTDDIRMMFYAHMHLRNNGKNEPRWRGVQVVKFPADLILYAQAIFTLKPDYIIETGTKYGGSAIFFADMLDLFVGGDSKVISVDIMKRPLPEHKRVEYITGSSADPIIVEEVKSRMNKRSDGKITGNVMVVLDSDHSKRHVMREMRLYGPLVTPRQFMVVEDCYMRDQSLKGPGHAVEWYLTKTNKFVREPVEDQFIFAVSRGGWLRRV